MKTASTLSLLLVIILIGINLRPALASISPIIEQIQSTTGLSDSMIGLLTAFPVFIMGVGNGLVPLFRQYISTKMGVFSGVIFITLACVSRFFYTLPGLLIGSAILVGVGIALVQSLLPGFVKTHFQQRTGLVMGLYTTSIMSGAAISSFVSPFIAIHYNTGLALGLWCVPAIAAGIFWLFTAIKPSVANQSHRYRENLPNTAIVWRLCTFFGLSTGAYTLVLAWLPDYYIALGWSELAAGGLLSLVTIAEVVAGLAVSFLLDRFSSRKPAIFSAICAMLLGLILLIFMPITAVYPSCILLGLGIGALFPLSLIVTMDHAKNSEQAITLSSVVQGSGYVLAALFPLIAGLIKQHLTNLSFAWVGMALISFVLLRLTAKFYTTPHNP